MKKWFGILIMVTAIVFILFNLNSNNVDGNKFVKQSIPNEPSFEYGILTDSFSVTKGIVENGQTLGEILYSNHVDHPEIYRIVQKSKEIFDVRRVNTGNPYTIMCSQDSLKKVQIFIYEENAINYVVFDLRNGIDVYKGKKEVDEWILSTTHASRSVSAISSTFSLLCSYVGTGTGYYR